MLRNNYEKDKCIIISEYIYDNYDKFIINPYIQKYISESTNLINKYKNIWQHLDDKHIISNILALNLTLLFNL